MTRIILLFSLLFAIPCKSQTDNIDSLKQAISMQPEDSNKVKSMNKLISALTASDDYSTALQIADRAKILSEKINYKNGMINSYGNIGLIYSAQGDYEKAVECFQKGLKLAEETGNKKLVGNMLMDIGMIYSEMSDNPKALEYYMKAEAIWKELDFQHGLSVVMMNMGTVYFSERNYDKALEYNLHAKQEAEKINDEKLKANSLVNIGMIYGEMKNSSEAEKSFNEALAVYESTGDKYGKIKTQIQIGNNYFNNGNAAGAISFHKSAEMGAREINNAEFMKEIAEALSREYEHTGNLRSALDYQIRFKQLSDSINIQDKSKEIVQMEMKFETEKKEAVLKKEENEKEAMMNHLHKQQSTIYLIIISGILLVGFIIYFVITQSKIRELNFTIQNQNQQPQQLYNQPVNNPYETKGPNQ